MMSRIYPRHWKVSGRHFHNGCPNTAQIQHCPISTTFYMWVDNDVPNWFPILKIFYRSLFSKWPPQFHKNSILSDIIKIWYVDIVIYPHMKSRWIRTMLNLCSIVAAILKMATGRNFSISGINSGHHNLTTYEMSLKSDNVEFVRYCGGHFENGDRYKFFDVRNQFGTSRVRH
jgi:hypothetical protein